jgi:hypothetical protein
MRAMANGVKFGRKRKLSDYQRAEAIKRTMKVQRLRSSQRATGLDRDDLAALIMGFSKNEKPRRRTIPFSPCQAR